MKPSHYREQWTTLTKQEPNIESVSQLARQVAFSFMDHHFHRGCYEEAYIDLLCEMATSSESLEVNRFVAAALFGIIVEGLCDDFEEMQTQTYNRVMSQVISFCRSLPAGKDLDHRLDAFGVHSSGEFLQRIDRIRTDHKVLPLPEHISKILLLSRVTIGADVAITSVVVQRLSKRFPDAEIVILGSKKLEEIYGGNPRIRIMEVLYNRRGGLIERLSNWHDVLDIIDREINHSSQEKFILVDPDSRLSQLGTLPLVPSSRYFFFDSRSAESFDHMLSIAELTNRWLDTILETTEFYYPALWAPQHYLEKAASFCRELREGGSRNVFIVNLGVGGNYRKRVEGDFEKELLLCLLKEPRSMILLDRGFGEEEMARTKALLDSVSDHGYPVVDASFDALKVWDIISGVVGIHCSIGEIAALIANGDEFIGYDSACQHIAAALGVPTLTVFAGSNNMRFVRRWSACGKNKHTIVHVDTLSTHGYVNSNDLVKRVMDARMNS